MKTLELHYPMIQFLIIVKYPPIFKNCARCVKDLKDNKHDSIHLGRKYARIFVLGHYLFLEAHSSVRYLFASRNR